MEKNEKIDAIKESIKESKVQLDKVKNTLDLVEHEIDLLSTRYAQLCISMRHMKKDGVVVMASEYNDTKGEIEITKERLAHARIERENTRAIYANIDNVIFSLRNKILDIIEEHDNLKYGAFGCGYDG